jgi:hypothetical protein
MFLAGPEYLYRKQFRPPTLGIGGLTAWQPLAAGQALSYHTGPASLGRSPSASPVTIPDLSRVLGDRHHPGQGRGEGITH